MLAAFQLGDQGLGNARLLGERPLRESLFPAALGKAIWIERAHLQSILRVDRPHLHAGALRRPSDSTLSSPNSKLWEIVKCTLGSANERKIDEAVADD